MATKMFRVGLIQLRVGQNKAENVNRAVKLIKEAKSKDCELVVLPECFNSPYGTKYFPQFAESVPTGSTCQALASTAKDTKMYIVGGSLPEVDEGKYYNTCTVWGPSGELLAKHRKVHLFDIDIPDKITFKESEILSPGQSLTTFDMNSCKIGLGICYDLRFEQMARIYQNEGCYFLIYPGAFNMTTGPLHWELLLRARANDNQVYVAGVSPARDECADYVAWGHTTIVDPWGKVVAKAEFEEDVIYADVDLNLVNEVRRNIPTSKQSRTDVYKTKLSS